MNLPKYESSSSKGESGITTLKRIVEKELGWIFRKNHQEHDFGIDGYIDIISSQRELTGKSIAVQVKTGKSFFKEVNKFGWIFRGASAHLNYYLNQDIPVVIILVDDELEKAYWCLCDPAKTEKAGENWKITVPFQQELTTISKNELEKYVSPVVDYVSQMEHFWLINSMIRSSEKLIFIVGREDIDNFDFDSLKAAFDRLSVSPEIIHSTKNKVDVLIHGYDEDKRELRDIAEVKLWVAAVVEKIEGLVYYLNLKRDAQFMRVIQLCTYKFEQSPIKIFRNGRLINQVSIDLESGVDTLNMLYHNLNMFVDKHGISEDTNREVSYRLGEFIVGKKIPRK